MRADVAYQIISDELFLDGNARQNLATFCQTWDGRVRPQAHGRVDQTRTGSTRTSTPQSAAIETCAACTWWPICGTRRRCRRQHHGHHHRSAQSEACHARRHGR
ncbi:MAG: hypothetical protein MZV65_31155 [Chromatiales bacterium]|nr:hypothetical protein [Chromatiales bacterium]